MTDRVLLAVLITAALALAACTSSGTLSATEGLEVPAEVASVAGDVISPECDAAFEAAANVDPMQDSVEDLYPAVEACATTAEWEAGFEKHGGAGFVGDALGVLANVCRGAPELSDAALCQEVD